MKNSFGKLYIFRSFTPLNNVYTNLLFWHYFNHALISIVLLHHQQSIVPYFPFYSCNEHLKQHSLHLLPPQKQWVFEYYKIFLSLLPGSIYFNSLNDIVLFYSSKGRFSSSIELPVALPWLLVWPFCWWACWIIYIIFLCTPMYKQQQAQNETNALYSYYF